MINKKKMTNNISKILEEFDKLIADIGYRALHGKKYDSEKETKDFIKQSIEKCLDEMLYKLDKFEEETNNNCQRININPSFDETKEFLEEKINKIKE